MASARAEFEESPEDQLDLPVEISGPALIQLHSGIQGASIEYRLDDDPHWLLYCGPIALQSGQPCTVHARADRIGFEPSPEISVQFICTERSPEHSHLL